MKTVQAMVVGVSCGFALLDVAYYRLVRLHGWTEQDCHYRAWRLEVRWMAVQVMAVRETSCGLVLLQGWTEQDHRYREVSKFVGWCRRWLWVLVVVRSLGTVTRRDRAGPSL